MVTIMFNKNINIMNRKNKKILLFIVGLFCAFVYCEYLIYYVVIAQCSWPELKKLHQGADILKTLILSDPHLLGPRKGYWIDKWRREWQMHQAFQTILTLHKPQVVFVLGDLFDEGEWSNDEQFDAYVERFYNLFSVPDDTGIHVVVGNHDIGFHHRIKLQSAVRFSKLLKAPSVQLITLKNIHFVLLNSMAMEGDSCDLCKEARSNLERISETLQCAQYPEKCTNPYLNMNYSRPIFMQHFPLYRTSDSICTEADAAPLSERNIPFRLKIDALSKEATDYIVSKIKPRAVFGGHTHHGCLVRHEYKTPETVIEFNEYSVPSFSWRNRLDPKYLLVTVTPEDYAVNKCGLPRETTMAISAVLFVLIFSYLSVLKKLYVRRYKCQ